MQLVVFSLQDKYYAISSEQVEEITGPVDWTEVPKTPDWLLGLMNLRGNVISLIHFEQFLNFEGKKFAKENLCYNNTVIVNSGKSKTAFAIDQVEEVIQVDEEDIQLPNRENVIQGVFSRGEKLINLIHLPTLFAKNEGSN